MCVFIVTRSPPCAFGTSLLPEEGWESRYFFNRIKIAIFLYSYAMKCGFPLPPSDEGVERDAAFMRWFEILQKRKSVRGRGTKESHRRWRALDPRKLLKKFDQNFRLAQLRCADSSSCQKVQSSSLHRIQMGASPFGIKPSVPCR